MARPARKGFKREECCRILEASGLWAEAYTKARKILLAKGATPIQAGNGAFAYLHYRTYLNPVCRCSQASHDAMLDVFTSRGSTPRGATDSIVYLLAHGCSYPQAMWAVKSYRRTRGLSKKRRRSVV
jgi:hypothetical protein